MFVKLLALKKAYLSKEDGATAIEYGLIAAGISLAIASVVFVFGEDLVALFETMGGDMQGAIAAAEARQDAGSGG